ncbi:uncharacterized protein LOC132061632 [Lycium ferocissimum]|uniref:uncharacterized protein LOC132061632 n=1 Tax=Lycium ferocissimum TaxID=112874 RepID=UPI0028150DE5|nr:uncharacterized protein LOC132061632 [Lycium ferocissimum]
MVPYRMIFSIRSFIKDTCTEAWNRLVHLFQTTNRLGSCFDAKFTNTKLVDFPNVKAYCTRLKVLADNLANVGHKVFNERLVLRLLRGLSEKYKTFRTMVQHRTPLPSFDVVRVDASNLRKTCLWRRHHPRLRSNVASRFHNVNPHNFSSNGSPTPREWF